MIDLDLYRKLAGTYGVDNSEQNAINEFARQSDKIWDATISTYDLLAPTKRGDDVIVYDFNMNPIESRAVFNYKKDFTNEAMEKGQERVFLQNGLGKIGYYIDRLRTNETYLVTSQYKDKFEFDDMYVNRCNGTLKWYHEGVLLEYKCVFNRGGYYDLKKDTMIMLADNQMRVLVQYNQDTKTIKFADVDSPESKYTRFIIEGDAFKVTSIDKQTKTINGVGYMDIRLQADLKKTSDDLINNIADANQVITVDIQNGATLTIGEGQSVQLNTAVTLNGEELVNPVVNYTTSNEAIATVNSTGLVSGVSSGSVNIGATYSTASDSIAITVETLASDNYTVDITASNYVIDIMRLGEQVTYTSTSLNNGVAYSASGAWSLLADDGATPLNSNIVSIVSTIGNVIKLKCSSNSTYKGTYFRLKYVDANANNELRMQIKGLW